ncbi:MAG: type II secretion system F family protein [Armatimonadota bacterium]|nr:type II secretion system F family protein [Armatimonadota bacterium]MCX7776496.1 type II secretion system F family protein [Armatimonadota bacterium]MDW8024293.1 type II secretion system F family protein [Armatimonadota bacterium]
MRLKLEELAIMLRQMSAAFRSGMTTHETLKMLEETSSDRNKRFIYRALAIKCSSGMKLSEAMGALPRLFPRWLIGIVKAGERTGRIANALELAAEQYEVEAAWRRRWKWCRLYLCVCAIALAFLLPLPRALLNGFQWYASLVLKLVFPGLLLLCGAVLIWSMLKRLHTVDALVKQLVSSVPLLGCIVTHNTIANFLFSAAQAIDAGMSASDAIEVGSEAVDVLGLRAKAMRARKEASAGTELSKALFSVGLLNRSEISSIHVGERTGTVVQALMQIADERRKRAMALRWMILTLQFAILHIAVAAGIIFSAHSIYQAMFEWVEREFEVQ